MFHASVLFLTLLDLSYAELHPELPRIGDRRRHATSHASARVRSHSDCQVIASLLSAAVIFHLILRFLSIPSIVKMYGPHLKASAAMVRLRLYDVLSLLPPNTYEASFSALLRELVAEFTLTDNPANTTTSLLRSLCHADDSVILGSWLQETDHKAIEDQVCFPAYTQRVGRGVLFFPTTHASCSLWVHVGSPLLHDGGG